MSSPIPQPTAPASTPEIRIDRLVLDIPGLDPAHVRALALGIAEGLADAGRKDGALDGVAGERAAISVRLADAGAPPDLAAKVVAALIERLA
jgi:hypothetical protein